jgi:hypothetical protein
MTTRARTSLSGGQERVATTRRRQSVWWSLERATLTRVHATLHWAQAMKKMRTDTRASGRARTSTAYASPPKASAAWHVAPRERRARRMTRTSTSRMR